MEVDEDELEVMIFDGKISASGFMDAVMGAPDDFPDDFVQSCLEMWKP